MGGNNNTSSHSFQQRRNSGKVLLKPDILWQSDRAVSTSTKPTTGNSQNEEEVSMDEGMEAGADEEELDLILMNSKTMLEGLGDDPTADELVGIAAVRTKEYLDECLSTEVPSGVVDPEIWEDIPQFTKMDLIIGQHLGKGTFSDVFEVIASIVEDDEPPTRESLDLDSADLDKLIKRKFHSCSSTSNCHGEDKDMEQPKTEESRAQSVESTIHVRATRRHTTEDITPSSIVVGTSDSKPRTTRTLAMKCLRPQNRSNMDQFMIGVEDLVNETAMLASLDHPNIIKLHGRAGGSATNAFRLSDGFFILLDRLRDTLVDRICSWKKTLSANKKAISPSMSQLKTACSIADALSYLHSKNIVFRDLKPSNVGFSSNGVVKLFDFGFSKRVADPRKSPFLCSSSDKSENGKLSHQLYDRCGLLSL